MRRKTLLCLLFLFLIPGCSELFYIKEGYEKGIEAAADSLIDSRLLLIGDAGKPSFNGKEPVLRAMQEKAGEIPDKTLNIFLGDNIYPLGLEAEDNLYYETIKRRLDEQIDVVKNSGTKGIFIPGNHDWGNGNYDGWERINRQERYIDSFYPVIKMMPEDGCPGPVIEDIGDRVRVIFLDSQWWLHNNIKPDINNSGCYPVTEDDVINTVDSLIKTSGERFVVIAAHHPLNTYGPHGGYFDWKEHIFPLLDFNKYLWIPLPLIGSIYPLARMNGISPQDISNSSYQNFISRMEEIISENRNIVYVSGHEHSLQVMEGIDNNLYLISGYGTSAHNNTLSYGEKSILSVQKPGFMQIDFLNNDQVRLGVYIINDDEVCQEIFSTLLF